MKVIKCGSEITTKIGGIKAIITAVAIRFEKVQYEISYFEQGDYKTAWIDHREFTLGAHEMQTIGFRRN